MSTSTDYFYQAVGFHFSVTFHGLGGPQNVDIRFQSVSGLDVEMETTTLKEGGENGFSHVLPVNVKFSSILTLKRGVLMPGQSGLTDWFIDALIHFRVVPLSLVSVELLNENHQILAKWDVEFVWPKSWKIGELNAERSEILIETLELHYNRFTFKNS